jgi:hypothetical protein
VADLDYLESGDTREVNGIFYPDWGEGGFTLELEWEPTVFAISDGEDRVVTLFNPETFGAAPEEAIYTVESNYTFVDGEERHARLYFQDGVMRHVFGINGEGDTGSPWEITPENGDQVTLLERWLDLDENGQVVETVMQPGTTLTFGEQPFVWEEVFAPTGQYVLGFIVEDLDGNQTATYAEIAVR